MIDTERYGLRFDPGDPDETVRRLIIAVNEILNGRDNACGELTLTDGVTSTVVTDYNCTADSCVVLTPKTATAATAIGNGAVYVTPGDRSFTVTHDNTADTDRTFMYALRGG